MAVSKEEALAFVDHVLTGKGLIHFQAVLGRGQAPDAEDFVTGLDGAVSRCEDFLALLGQYHSCLGGVLEATEKSMNRRKAKGDGA